MTAAGQPMTSRERTARHRARRREGVRLADGVEVTDRAIEKFIEADWASPEEISDKRRLADIVTNFLDCWARGTLRPPR